MNIKPNKLATILGEKTFRLALLAMAWVALLSSPSATRAQTPTAIIDDLIVGDDKSEEKHKLKADKSEVFRDARGQSARRLLPGGEKPWEGGRLGFTMKV